MRYVSQKRIEDAKKALNRGDVLAVPTENFYGLTVKLDNTAAIRKLLDIKNRQIDSAKILTLLVADVDDIKKYASIDRKTLNMARHYFPGELTLILPKHRTLKHPYFDHFETVGVRIPEHKYLLELIRTTGPLLAIGAMCSLTRLIAAIGAVIAWYIILSLITSKKLLKNERA